MSFIEIDLTGVEERKAVEAGEYTLIVRSVEARNSESGHDYLVVRFAIADVPEAKMISHTIFLPSPGYDPERMYESKLQLKRFLDAIGYQPEGSQINLEELQGLRCRAILAVREDDEYGVQNRIRRFVSSAF